MARITERAHTHTKVIQSYNYNEQIDILSGSFSLSISRMSSGNDESVPS